MELTLSQLVAERIRVKREEEAAVALRRDLDAAICARVAGSATTGSVTERTDNFKVTVTRNVNIKVEDAEKLQADWTGMPADIQAAFRWKPEVDVAKLKKLPEPLRALADTYLITQPASPTLRIEVA